MQFEKSLNKHDAAVQGWWRNVPWAIEHIYDEDERERREARNIVCYRGLTNRDEIEEWSERAYFMTFEIWGRYEEAQADHCAKHTDIKGIIKSVLEKQKIVLPYNDGNTHWLRVRKICPLAQGQTYIWEQNKIASRLDCLYDFGDFWIVDTHDLLEGLISDVYNNPTKWFSRWQDEFEEIMYTEEGFQEKVEDFVKSFVEPLNYCDLLDIKPQYVVSREAHIDNEEAFSILKLAKQYYFNGAKCVHDFEFGLIKDAFNFLRKRSYIHFEDDSECAYYAYLFATFEQWQVENLYDFGECDLLTSGARSVKEHCDFAFAMNMAFQLWCTDHRVELG